MGNNEEKKVGVARLKPTRYDDSKGNRIGPRILFDLRIYSCFINIYFFDKPIMIFLVAS